MIYEQAGYGIFGRGVLMENGDILILKDCIVYYIKIVFFIIEVVYWFRLEMLKKFEVYFDKVMCDLMGEYWFYVISKDNLVGKFKVFIQLLDCNNI